MARRSQKGRKSQTKVQELVTVAFADSADQAKDYEAVLKSNDIPVIIREQDEQDGGKVIAVMVPEDFIDEAHVVIESQDAYDDFYDLTLEIDEDESDFDDDFFDEVP